MVALSSDAFQPNDAKRFVLKVRLPGSHPHRRQKSRGSIVIRVLRTKRTKLAHWASKCRRRLSVSSGEF
jgi:hypothetical protein